MRYGYHKREQKRKEKEKQNRTKLIKSLLRVHHRPRSGVTVHFLKTM